MNTLSFTRISAVVLRQWYEFKSHWNRIFDTFFWPVIDLFIWGITFQYLATATPEINFTKVILGGVLFWTFVYSIQKDISLGMMQDVWDRNLANIFTTPLTKFELILGSIIIALMKMVLLGVIMGIGAYLLYGFNVLQLAPILFSGLFTVTLFGISFGLFTSAFIIHMGANVQTLIWSALGILMPLLCIYYPVSALPDFLEPFALALPPTHVFEWVRNLMKEGITPSVFDFLIPNLINFTLLALAILYFEYAFRNAKERGWLVKMD